MIIGLVIANIILSIAILILLAFMLGIKYKSKSDKNNTIEKDDVNEDAQVFAEMFSTDKVVEVAEDIPVEVQTEIRRIDEKVWEDTLDDFTKGIMEAQKEGK